MFGMMGNLWKLFYYSPKKAESLKEIQSILKLPELKIVKPSDTRWLSHERCVGAIFRELPALIITLQQLYETSGDAEAYGLSNLLATYTDVASVVFLSEVLDILARANASMLTKLADFSKFPIFLKVMTDQLEHMKETSEWLGTVETVISQLQEKYDMIMTDQLEHMKETSEWLGTVETVISQLQEKYDIVLGKHGSRRSNWSSITSVCEYRTLVAIPYIDSLLENIRNRFSDRSLKIVTAMSIFNPAMLPSEESLSSYGNEQIKLLAGFYEEECKNSLILSPTMQDILEEMMK